ncbi:MAG: hypothetical protein E5W31_07785, partial [Mesorhizobium sp.]
MTRVCGAKPAIQRATLDDLARYAGEPKLGLYPFPNVVPPVVSGVVGPIVTFRGAGNSTDTFSIGTASADRVVLALSLAVRGASTPRDLTGHTYDGAAGSTPTTNKVGAGTTGVTVGISSKLITTGTTCAVAASYS